MIPLTMLNFAAENVVAPEGVHRDYRDNQQRANQHKALTLRRSCRLPQRNGRWNDVGPDTDPQPAEPEKNQPQRQYKRQRMAVLLTQRAPQPEANQRNRGAEPASGTTDWAG